MNWKFSHESISKLAADAMILFYTEDCVTLSEDLREVDYMLEGHISRLMIDGEITGKFGEVTILRDWNKKPMTRVFITGLGKKEKVDLFKLKDAVAIAARKAKKIGLKQLSISSPSYMIQHFNPVDIIQSLVEGIELGTYQHHTYQEHKQDSEPNIILSCKGFPEKAVEIGVERGIIFSQATNLARFLTNEPANRLNPESFTQYAQKIAEKSGLSIEILEEDQLISKKMQALLSVSAGSKYGAKMVVLSYNGAPDCTDVIGLVGKGVTYDSGGLQIKKDAHVLSEMKVDMAGGAAVLGAMEAIGAIKPHTNVIAVIPLCENMIDSNAYRPGDVISTYSGKTIEITHTDAEGRLVLADALTYIKQLGATKLVDVATLTGTVYSTFGHEVSAMMTNNQDWSSEVLYASKITGERIWELPLYEEYEELMQSEIADLKNFGGWGAVSIQGGIFLKHFVGETPWVHLDITGTILRPEEKGVYEKGATGAIVRTLIQLAMRTY
ncbi:leucyl aminopeptidase [Thermoflavimicrobium daqui]|jgi:leucyl aminopeptidase|uniref:Probable cytosol aminopeptidase n=1 Tax=Thermoflavimicrobium daqui TaxID=2137476 RepID=A0A364K6P7_9BACL|nr:leucyl aminopeptidase [Thermoflavimicrobium daqui]RAL25981.1 leucyl aminopeptidase [Thermoflavimicrobium daqui]